MDAHALPVVLVSLIEDSFWDSVFSKFVKPKFWPKKTEMVICQSYGEKLLLLGFNKKV